jgi:ABC-type transporter Mla maintaining outer membrane lipid asymmetry ATPase subunit MlaF
MRKVADKVVFLHDGHVIYFGPTDEMNHAEHEHIQEFLAMDRVEM